jgi:hypothetical protein
VNEEKKAARKPAVAFPNSDISVASFLFSIVFATKFWQTP